MSSHPHKKTCLLVLQEDMSSCRTRSHVLLFNRRTCLLVWPDDPIPNPPWSLSTRLAHPPQPRSLGYKTVAFIIPSRVACLIQYLAPFGELKEDPFHVSEEDLLCEQGDICIAQDEGLLLVQEKSSPSASTLLYKKNRSCSERIFLVYKMKIVLHKKRDRFSSLLVQGYDCFLVQEEDPSSCAGWRSSFCYHIWCQIWYQIWHHIRYHISSICYTYLGPYLTPCCWSLLIVSKESRPTY